MRRKLILPFIVLLLALSLPSYLHPAHGLTTWSNPSPVYQSSGLNILPAALQARDGTLWVAWQSNSLNPLVSRYDILYKTLSGGVWSAPTNITSRGNNVNNVGPSLVQTTDGTVLLFWSANTTGLFKVYYDAYSHGVWSNPTLATSGTANDCTPTATLGRDGTLWLFWSRGVPCYAGNVNLFYKTMNSGVWSAEKQLTFDTTADIEPKASVSNDGRVWVVFASYISARQNSQVFYTVYDGVTWSPENSVVTSNLFDDHPDLLQDRNGTLWFFWTRELNTGGGGTEDKVFAETSINNGVTWSTETRITSDPTCCQVDDWGPSAVQGLDHSLWLFYSSSYPLGGNFDIYYIQSSPIFPVHHVIVSQITVSPVCPFSKLAPSSPACLYPGGMKMAGESPIVNASVTVSDIGDFVESVNVRLTAVNTTSYPVGSLSGSVSAGGTATLTFVWNTTRSEKPGRYGLTATISGVSETAGNLGDNSLLTKNLVHLIPLGDMDQDGSVDFVDASTVAIAYNSTPASLVWNPYADFDSDGYVSFLDVSTMAANFGIKT